MSLNKLKACYCWSLPFLWMVAPKEAVCISKCSFVLLVLQAFFEVIIFHFTRRSEHQPTGNLHSSTKLLAWHLWPVTLHISFHHVQENTKILASTFKAWQISTHAYRFNCLPTSWSIIQCCAIMLKKIALREHLNFFVVNKIKVWQVKFRYLKSSLIWQLVNHSTSVFWNHTCLYSGLFDY